MTGIRTTPMVGDSVAVRVSGAVVVPLLIAILEAPRPPSDPTAQTEIEPFFDHTKTGPALPRSREGPGPATSLRTCRALRGWLCLWRLSHLMGKPVMAEIIDAVNAAASAGLWAALNTRSAMS